MTNYLFGPVPSRRLGRSLGIDLVPFKTCPYDCIYCQLGPTTCKTRERKEWRSLDGIARELREFDGRQPDYITLSGSGEPTLYSRIDELIQVIKSVTDVPVAVLTNGALLDSQQLRQQLHAADLVIPSLDAGSEHVYQAINRPVSDISFNMMLSGLIALRNEFSGAYWLEVMLVEGYNTHYDDIRELADCANRIRPDRIQLNTVTRPPCESTAAGAPRHKLAEFATLFSPTAEVIADYRAVHQSAEFSSSRDDVLTLLQRRPCSIDDIAAGLVMHRNEVVKYVEELREIGAVESTRVDNREYYSVSPRPSHHTS
jgi:wyosine [tRNA(Phe)-imidazoG37] synthetase (radical SAM superfamily)